MLAVVLEYACKTLIDITHAAALQYLMCISSFKQHCTCEQQPTHRL